MKHTCIFLITHLALCTNLSDKIKIKSVNYIKRTLKRQFDLNKSGLAFTEHNSKP